MRFANVNAKLTWICPECGIEIEMPQNPTTVACPFGCGEFGLRTERLRGKLQEILAKFPKPRAIDKIPRERRHLCKKRC